MQYQKQLIKKNKDPPCSSTNLRAFSKKDGAPSSSSRASKIGRPTTLDFVGSLSFTIKIVQKNNLKGRLASYRFL